ncbi:MAG: response regulator transcription factor [Candidatus Saccharibacteria bacterium]|nr:response regulator transcription factor [Candidatus Saccharibacteria bacterium]
MQTNPRLLLIEDDRIIASALSQALKTSYAVDVASTGKSGIYKTDSEYYDAIILDLHLPDIHGLAVCQQLRERGVSVPVLILSGESNVLTKINLLDAGANDYLTKPFSLGELKARLRTLTRSTDTPSKASSRLEVGDLRINTITHEASRDGQPIKLRRKEFLLLECLMAHQGIVVSRQALSRYGWAGVSDNWTNTIDVHIKHLRDKVDRPFERPMIKTVHGVGYRIDALPKVVDRPCVL